MVEYVQAAVAILAKFKSKRNDQALIYIKFSIQIMKQAHSHSFIRSFVHSFVPYLLYNFVQPDSSEAEAWADVADNNDSILI